MPCPPITITGVTPEEWDHLVAAAAQHGILVPGDSGLYDSNGFRVGWYYARTTETIVVSPMDVPISCGLFESLLRHAYATI
jgi:hypothetical protein